MFLKLPTEQVPRAKDGLGLEGFSASIFASYLRGLGDTNDRCAVFRRHGLDPARFGSIPGENAERAYVDGYLASGQAGEFDASFTCTGW